jgi:hypothetical protein
MQCTLVLLMIQKQLKSCDLFIASNHKSVNYPQTHPTHHSKSFHKALASFMQKEKEKLL